MGYISVAENSKLPFEVKRVYWTYKVPLNVERGGHAHISLEQVIVAVSGTIRLNVETFEGRKYNFVLNSAHLGVYLPSNCWRTMTYSKDAVQMCLASEEYDEADYIRDIDEFREGQRL